MLGVQADMMSPGRRARLPPPTREGIRMSAEPVLVAFASRHHGTEGIAAEIAATLRADGFQVDLRRADTVTGVGRYAAVILGSAVYMAQWESAALGLLQRERRALAERPVWLFSSGPVGAGRTTRRPDRVPQPEAVTALATEIGVRGLAMFGGRVDTSESGFDIQVMSLAGLEGDWRDLGKVRAWAHAVAAVIQADALPNEPAAAGRPGF
jgi:menaquinone-dependent protoporphyrinogen oxidase